MVCVIGMREMWLIIRVMDLIRVWVVVESHSGVIWCGGSRARATG